jgi:hypothetical protein
MTDESCAPSLSQNPGPGLHGWVVPHVLGVTALQIGDPVFFLVPVEADDPSLDRRLRRCV